MSKKIQSASNKTHTANIVKEVRSSRSSRTILIRKCNKYPHNVLATLRAPLTNPSGRGNHFERRLRCPTGSAQAIVFDISPLYRALWQSAMHTKAPNNFERILTGSRSLKYSLHTSCFQRNGSRSSTRRGRRQRIPTQLLGALGAQEQHSSGPISG